MKVIRNTRYIETRGKIGRYTSLAGLAVLFGGMLISLFQPKYITISFVCLMLGFVLSQVGIYYGNRFVRPDRPEEALSKALKGLDDRYVLYVYETPVAHVLLAPEACYVLSVYPQSGKIRAQGDRWKQSLGWRAIFAWMSQEGVSNPSRAALSEAETLKRYVAKQLPDVELDPTPVVVFSNPNVDLEVSDTPVPVMHIKKLKDWLRGPGKSQGLGGTARTELLKLFGNGAKASSAS